MFTEQRFLCPQEAQKRNPIICARASASCTCSDLQCGCLSLANHLLLLQGLDLKQVAVQLRAWSWPVRAAHSLSRLLLLLAQWLAGSSPCWKIFWWCGYPLWHRLPVLWLFALGYRCRLLCVTSLSFVSWVIVSGINVLCTLILSPQFLIFLDCFSLLIPWGPHPLLFWVVFFNSLYCPVQVLQGYLSWLITALST